MRIVFFLILLVGLGLAGTGAYMVMQMVNDYEAQLAAEKRNRVVPIEMTEVIVAKARLPFGKSLVAADIEIIPWPADYVPFGAFSDVDALLGNDPDKPRAIRAIIERHEPILMAKVTDFGEDIGLRGRISDGMRAFTLKVDVTSGVSGFLQPNDRVDIFWTGNDGEGQTITQLILEAVRLIAIDQTDTEDPLAPRIAKTVTVEVSPEVVAKLTQAQQTGRITLSLRSAGDESSIEDQIRVDTRDVTGNEVQQVERARVCTIRTRRGTEIIEMQTACPEGE